MIDPPTTTKTRRPTGHDAIGIVAASPSATGVVGACRSPHHAPGRSARRTKITTTAPTDGEYSITRALAPDRLFGSGSNNKASGSISRHITSRAGETASARSAAVGQGGSNPQL